MRIHHFTVPAHDPAKVAAALAEILGAKGVSVPHPEGTLLVYAGVGDGTAIEVWPAKLRIEPTRGDLALRELPLPEAWPHHAFVTSDACSTETILAIFAREGWRAERVQNGPPGRGFSLVRGFIENHTGIELGGSEMRAEYERYFQTLRGAA